jgi:hypothetical protein
MFRAPLLVVALLALLLSACTTNRFYTPNTMNIPMLAEAGQGTITGGVTTGSKNTGWEAQATYSPIKHLGLMVNHFDLRYKGETSTTLPISSFFEQTAYTGKTRLTEGAVGGYYQVGPEKEYLLSLFAGFGQGHTENRYTPYSDPPSTEAFVSDWRYQRYFIQPALSLKYNRFQVGTGIRFGWVNYLDGNINSRVGQVETQRIELLESSSPLFFTEMAWSIGWRLKPIVVSLNSTAVVRGKNTLRDLDLASNYVSLTVGLNIHELRKKF